MADPEGIERENVEYTDGRKILRVTDRRKWGEKMRTALGLPAAHEMQAGSAPSRARLASMDEASTGRMRRGQSTDHQNGY